MDELHRLLARRIREVARARGITQMGLVADLVGVSRAQLYRLLRGASSPTLALIGRIADGLDVPAATLLSPGPAPLRPAKLGVAPKVKVEK